MATGNAADWLTAHGFLPGMGGPGDFRVGDNSSHMQATLPGGIHSTGAATLRGIGGTGADDPAFTSHYDRPVGAAGAAGSPATSAASAAYSGGLGTPSNPMYVVIAGQGGSPAAMAGGRGGASLGGGMPGGGDLGSMGKTLLGDLAQVFGFDGSVFSNPMDWGARKLAGGAIDMATGGGGGAGRGLAPLTGLLASIPSLMAHWERPTRSLAAMPAGRFVGAFSHGSIPETGAGLTVGQGFRIQPEGRCPVPKGARRSAGRCTRPRQLARRPAPPSPAPFHTTKGMNSIE